MTSITISYPQDFQVFDKPSIGGTLPIVVSGVAFSSTTRTGTRVIETFVGPVKVRLGTGPKITAVITTIDRTHSTWFATVDAPDGVSQVLTVEATITTTTTTTDLTNPDVISSSSHQETLTRTFSVRE